MKQSILLLCCLHIIALFAQVPYNIPYSGAANAAIGLGKNIAKEAQQNQKQKLATTYTETINTQYGSYTKMRVPKEKIKSKVSADIIQIQTELDNMNLQFMFGNLVEISDMFYTNNMKIKALDEDWVITAYLSEMEFYKYKYNPIILEKEKKKRLREIDSLATLVRIQQEQERKTRDSILRVNYLAEQAEKRKQDSLQRIIRAEEHAMRMAEIQAEAEAKIKQDSITRANQPKVIYIEKETPPKVVYIEKEANNSSSSSSGSGFAPKNTITKSSKSTSNSGNRSYSGTSRTTNKGVEYYNGHRVYTGPRGGRYYINSNGNKTYIQ